MALKLGEMLVQEGLITSAQLEEALKYQVIFGGKLGTNLIEMGMVEEASLAKVLSRKLGVPWAGEPELMNIPLEIIKLIPRDMAAKYKAIPLRLENRRLILVMADPTDLKAIDEIAFRTGFLVRPALTPEIRLVLALEKYYEIPRGIRFIHAGKKAPEARLTPPPSPLPRPPAKTSPSPSRPAPPEPSAGKGGVPASGISGPSTWSRSAGGAGPVPATASQKGNSVASRGVPSPTRPLAEPEAAPAEPSGEAVIRIPEASPEESVTFESVCRSLAEARDREDISDILASYLGEEFPRGALFLVRGNAAMGWKARTGGRPVPRFEQMEIPLDEPSALKTVTETKSFYLGPLSRTPFNSMMLQGIGGNVPASALLVPMMMMGRVVGILYVDGQNVNLAESLPALQKLTAKASMAFEILVLKNKIVSL
jgi:hypothetical protein